MAVKPKVCFVTVSLMTVKSFLLSHLRELSKTFEVTLVANIDDPKFKELVDFPLTLVNAPIERKINLQQDIKALIFLVKFFAANNFTMVKSIAPKAGLLAMLASWIVSVPVRLHVFQGEVWISRKGFMRLLLKNIDRLMSFCATHILVVSESERQFLIKNRIVSAAKSQVLLKGSICGVNLQKFTLNSSKRSEIRNELNLNEDDILLLFVGRLNFDKGVSELLTAFESIATKKDNIHLLIVGPDEENILDTYGQILIDHSKHIHIRRNFTPNPEHYMSASDLLVLPSHREGFGLVIIEAAAVGLTAVASDIYGITDALVDEKTGLLFECKNTTDLESKIMKLCEDTDLRQKLALQAQQRCIHYFEQSKVIEAYVEYYRLLVSSAD